MDPALVFGFWPPLLYFLFILLSTLRLDFWLSVWTGTVAAVQQIALVLWLLPIDTVGRASRRTAPLIYHFSRSLVLLRRRASSPAYVATQPAPPVREVGARRRRRATASPTCSASMSRPPWSTACWRRVRDPPSEMRTVCVMFLDIRGFTAMTRAPDGRRDGGAAQRLLREMIEVVDRQQRHHQQVPGRRLPGAVRCAARRSARRRSNALAAARGMLDAVDAWTPTTGRPRRCASASASISARR